LPGWVQPSKDFYYPLTEGGDSTLAFSKQQKTKMMEQYQAWFEKSKAMIMVEYSGLNMKGINAVRAKTRDAGGELHVVKNTLMRSVFKAKGLPVEGKLLEGSSAIGFAFDDAPAVAKAFTDFAKGNELFKIKGGYLGDKAMNPAQIKSLADLPPLPVMRATLLGVLQAPASKLVRTLAEPARGLAAVVKAHSEQTA
jgi:large subunit ribosomal protein L10